MCVCTGIRMHTGVVLCVHMGDVNAYGGCVCANGVVCVCIYGVVCVCIIWLVRSYKVFMFLGCCSFLSGHRLTLCAAVGGTGRPVPSYKAGWQRLDLHFRCHVVVAGGCWG